MNALKSINVWLVAVLCYSQLAASVHFVGHLELDGQHDHDSQAGLAGFARHDHQLDRHHLPHAAPFDTRAGTFSGSGERSQHDGKDCSIFHVYSSFGALIQSGSVVPCAVLQHVHVPTGPGSLFARSVKHHKLIRAPPVIA